MLAPQLPLQKSVPLATGERDEGSAFHWSVYEWIDGIPAGIHHQRMKRSGDRRRGVARMG